MIKNINNLKSQLLKFIDKWNDRYYFYQPQPVDFYHEFKKIYLYSTDTLIPEELTIYNDILSRISPDGIYNYRWDVQEQAKGIYIPDVGDLCLHHHLLIAAIVLRAINQNDADGTFKVAQILKRLLKASEMFITKDGYLLRGFRDYYKNPDWLGCKRVYADAEVSGDQLGGFCFGLSMAYHYFPEIFSEELKRKILLFADKMIINKMMLQDFMTGNTCKGEIPYDSWRMIEGHVTTKLALLSLAIKVEGKEYLSSITKYHGWYMKLIKNYSLDKLAEYSALHFIVPFLKYDLNNYFGTHINAISLFAIGLNIGFPDYIKRGLERIAWQTRDYGYGLYELLSVMASGEGSWCSGIMEEKIRQALYSYFVIAGEDIFVRNIFGKKIRVAPLSHRSKQYEDYYPQREPHLGRNNKNPDLWLWNNCGRVDILLEINWAKKEGCNERETNTVFR